MNGRFFGACFFIFGTKRSCCSIDDYSSILQQPLGFYSIFTDDADLNLPGGYRHPGSDGSFLWMYKRSTWMSHGS